MDGTPPHGAGDGRMPDWVKAMALAALLAVLAFVGLHLAGLSPVH